MLKAILNSEDLRKNTIIWQEFNIVFNNLKLELLLMVLMYCHHSKHDLIFYSISSCLINNHKSWLEELSFYGGKLIVYQIYNCLHQILEYGSPNILYIIYYIYIFYNK